MSAPDGPVREGGVAGRVLDVVVSASGLLLTSPVLLTAAIAIRLDSRGPAIYRSSRLGRHQRPFTLYKFRTMAVQGGPGMRVTSRGDPRVTRVGRWLRATKVDELPQLVNVLKGDMALVGPRPEDPRYLDAYRPEHLPIFDARPGITSPASIRFRHEEVLLATAEDVETFYREAVLPRKVEIDLAYLRRRSVLRDVVVIGETIAGLARRAPSEAPILPS